MARAEAGSRDRSLELRSKVSRALVRYGMVQPGDRVIVGVSGGVDSVCLLDVLHRLSQAHGLSLVVAHVHHGLRGEEADREFAFVEDRARRYGIPFEGRRIPPGSYPRGVNVQDQARRFRYAFYEEVAGRWGAARVATGHHRDDHMETVLIELFRGTGAPRGIVPVRDGRYIRPLIEIPREEILAYAQQQCLTYCEDSSNRKKTYLRNRIREELVPWVRREVNPAVSRVLFQLSSILREDTEYLDAVAEEALREVTVSWGRDDGVGVLDRAGMERLPRALQRRVLRGAFRRIAGSTQGLSYLHLEGVCEALAGGDGRPNRMFLLPGGIRLFLEYDALRFCRQDLWRTDPYLYPYRLGETLRIPEAGIVLTSRRSQAEGRPIEARGEGARAWMDGDLLGPKMIVRGVRKGDRFHPLGVGGEKKVKDFLIERKVPRSLRSRIPILVSGERIAWIVGYRVDDRFKVTDRTRSLVEFRAVPLEEEGVGLA